MPIHAELEGFFATKEPADLGPGPRVGVQSPEVLEKRLRPVLEASALKPERQELIRALVLLWHDHLDVAHGIAQSIEGPDGAFVHGIVHRREPDYGNASYWFRRVGRHPAFAQIASRAAPFLEAAQERDLAGKLIRDVAWDPFAFIEVCEQASQKLAAHQGALKEVQRIEFVSLLNSFCAD